MFPDDPGAKPWYVYVIYSESARKYYRGITTDPERRLKQHNSGKGAKYTRGRGPWVLYAVDLVGYCRSSATRTESWLRSLRKDDFKSWCESRRTTDANGNRVPVWKKHK